jgi:hypothetical protein
MNAIIDDSLEIIELKQGVSMFQDIVDHKMKAIIRINDRDYAVGKVVRLHEGQFEAGEFKTTGRTVSGVISHMATFGCSDGYLMLSLSRVGLTVVQS